MGQLWKVEISVPGWPAMHQGQQKGHLESGLPEVLLGLLGRTGKRIFGLMVRTRVVGRPLR